MRVHTIALLMCVVVVAGCANARAQSCPTEIDRGQLSLSYDAFDAAGWRNLVGNCTDAAVAQLMAYRDANWSRMALEQRLEIAFHIGQTLALARRDQESIPYFEQSTDASAPAEWSAYVDATIAFLRHDAVALAAARARYAVSPGASDMRLAIIDGFVTCADRPYVEAVHCGMGNMH